ncbi:Ribonuclease H-like domain containing protein [Trema orientale]|uniref:Ribonuclease H-like domain containing protein n=1 Tax=Trema orientale TaxID=63057 RepID=A0A2P5E2Z2_TREOI|nr:Ribonuclease H-like domain containing protein [Trema orientale]
MKTLVDSLQLFFSIEAMPVTAFQSSNAQSISLVLGESLFRTDTINQEEARGVGKLRHRKLANLIGYCCDGVRKLLHIRFKEESPYKFDCHNLQRKETKWTTRSQGCFKMNVDTALNEQTRAVGIGAIIGNDKGEVMATLAKKLDGFLSPKYAGAKAIGISLLWARDIGFNLQTLESDALAVVQTLNMGIGCLSEFRNLLLDIMSLFPHFLGIKVNHVFHEANEAAHRLAKLALQVIDKLVWLEETPYST